MGTIQGRCAVLLGAALLAAGCASSGAEQAQREVDRKRARSHVDLGVDHLENGRTALALREFLAAEALDPNDPRIQYALGEAYLRRGKLDDAEAHVLRALEIHPGDHDSRLLLSALYIHEGRYDDAIVQSDLLLDDPTFPGPWRALTNRGWAEFQEGRLAEARASLELAVEYNRRYWPAVLNLGILEAQEGHRLEATSRFRETLELEPGPNAEAEANYRLAEIYVSLGKRERAVGHLMAAVAQTPDGRWGKKSEEYLKLLR